MTLCVATILLAYSRGSLLAAGIGVALWFAIVPLRLRGVAVLALGAAGGAVVAVWTFGQTGLSDDRVALATREAAGYELGVALAVVLLVVLALSLAITFWAAEHPPNKETPARGGRGHPHPARARADRGRRGARAVRPRPRRLRLATRGGR